MKFKKKLIISLLITISPLSFASEVVLNGKSLTQEKAWEIADGATVVIDKKAADDLVSGYNLLMDAAASGKPVYGLTVGVGLNKDHKLFSADGKLSENVLKASTAFNYSTLRAHSAGVFAPMPINMTRLTMAIRLNTILSGHTGVQPYVAELYKEYLNKGITPIVPAQGTVGESDILLSSHFGLAMIGEWKVIYKGKEQSSKVAMQNAGIELLKPIGKDALSILSNNALSVAYAMDGYRKAKHLLDISPVVFGLSLEGLNGNISPFLPQTNDIRPFPMVKDEANKILVDLKGSYLWNINSDRPLQDPLSFRTSAYVFGSAYDALNELDKLILIQINHSDDNPAVILNADNSYSEFSQVSKYLIEGKGGVFPTTNFESLPLAIAVERLNIALVHVAHNSVERTIHLSDDHFTKLSRFLADSDNHGHAFGAIQKAFVDMQVRNQQLSMPVSFMGYSIAGTIEDTYSNLKLASENLIQIVDNTSVIYGIELLHSSQAIDLRKQKDVKISLGEKTKALYEAYRQKVSYVKQDRPYTDDIQASHDFITSYNNY